MTGAQGVVCGTMMGALYEDVEKFFGDIFAWYGRQVARAPWLFVMIPMLVCGMLGLGLFSLTYATDIEVLYTPIGSQAAKDQDMLESIFPDNTGDNFYERHHINRPTYGEVILNVIPRVSTEDAGACANSILSKPIINEIWKLHEFILNITAIDVATGRQFSFEDMCSKRDGECVVNGLEVLPSVRGTRQKRTYQERRQAAPRNGSPEQVIGPTERPPGGRFHTVLNLPVLSGYDADNTCPSVLRLRYNTRHNDTYTRDLSLAWEIHFLEYLHDYHSDVINVSYTVSESLDIELRDHVGTDTRFLGFSVLAMLIFATIIGSGINCVTNHVGLAYAGVFATLLAILGAFGLVSLLGLRFVNLSGVMPFLVLGIGADDMFQLLTEWRQSNIRDTIEERMAGTLRSTAVSITITSLTDLIAFCIGATSPFVSIRNFCACSGVAVLLCYVNQLTFYSGCIVLHARRVEASRHWLTCIPTKSREELEEERAHPVKVLLCSGSPPRRVGEEGGICRKVSRSLYTYYPRFLLHWITKSMVFLLFIGYISVSFFGAKHIKKGLKLEWVVPDESYLSQYLQMNFQYFPNNGPTIAFVVSGAHRYTHSVLLYHQSSVQDEIASLLSRAENLPTAVNGSRISWLEHYVAYRRHKNLTVLHDEREMIKDLMAEFFPMYPGYREDVTFNKDLSLITASRFFISSRQLETSEAEGEMMLQMRRVANSSPLHVLAYSPVFIYYEHYVSILKNTLLPVGVTMIGLLFVALVFIPHPIAVTCVTISMISIVVGMVGFMQLWGLSLSAITVIQVIMSLGICVSFTVHMSHSFMTATGKNRNERVTVAIEKVGIPILNGALSSLLCAIMLSFGTSFIFTSFFKTMILVFFLGILHSLVFLPVMLSFIGPRRTNKPRVFIPVSPSSRSLQDTYRANSISFHPTDIESRAASRQNSRQDLTRESSEPRSSQPRELGSIPDNNSGGPNTSADKPERKISQSRELGTIHEDIHITVDNLAEDEESDDRRRKVSFSIGTRENSPENKADAYINADSVLDSPGATEESNVDCSPSVTQRLTVSTSGT